MPDAEPARAALADLAPAAPEEVAEALAYALRQTSGAGHGAAPSRAGTSPLASPPSTWRDTLRAPASW
jgi:hypothetical protein